MSSFTVAQPARQRGVLGIKEMTYHIQVFKSQCLDDMLFMCYQRKTLHFTVSTKIVKKGLQLVHVPCACYFPGNKVIVFHVVAELTTLGVRSYVSNI